MGKYVIRLQIGELYCVYMIQNHCLPHDGTENILKNELIQRVEVAVENKAVTMQTVEAKKNSYFQGLKKIVNLLQW